MPSPTIIKATMETGKDIARNVNTKAHTGEMFHDNAIHMKMFGGKGIDVIPDHKGALLQVSGLGARPPSSCGSASSVQGDNSNYWNETRVTI